MRSSGAAGVVGVDLLTSLLPQSVYGLQNDIRTHSPTHVPAPEAKQPTEEELQEQVSHLLVMMSQAGLEKPDCSFHPCLQITFWQLQLDRHRLKMSKVAER